MDIIRDNRPVEPARKRDSAPAARPPTASGDAASTDASDKVDASDLAVTRPDQAAMRRLVDQLKRMQPADVQKIDDLRARIAAGTYTATPEELAEAILGGGRV
jgi:flagellar biosynthesis anti-sigma factor FlgM